MYKSSPVIYRVFTVGDAYLHNSLPFCDVRISEKGFLMLLYEFLDLLNLLNCLTNRMSNISKNRYSYRYCNTANVWDKWCYVHNNILFPLYKGIWEGGNNPHPRGGHLRKFLGSPFLVHHPTFTSVNPTKKGP
jgi:hypothetical protein